MSLIVGMKICTRLRSVESVSPPLTFFWDFVNLSWKHLAGYSRLVSGVVQHHHMYHHFIPVHEGHLSPVQIAQVGLDAEKQLGKYVDPND